MSTFDTFAPARPPASIGEVRDWFAYMNGHSNVPHPDDRAEEMVWATLDLMELFASPLNEARYNAAMDAAYRITGREKVDIYGLAMGAKRPTSCPVVHPVLGPCIQTGIHGSANYPHRYEIKGP